MSVASKLAESVDNGLKIVEFIQKNRESIQETHGRSAIKAPSSKERIKAWETFIEETNTSDSGSQGHKRSEEIRGDESDSGDSAGNTNQSGTVPSTNHQVSKPILLGSDSGRDDHDTNITADELSPDTGEELRHTDRGRRADMEGTIQNEGGSRSSTDADGRRGQNRSEDRSNQDLDPSIEAPRRMTVKEMTKDDLDQMLEETRPIPVKRIKHINSISELRDDIFTEGSPIKKTTEESTLSIPSMVRQSSGAGAIQSAPESPQSQEWRSVSVESAHKDALSANTTMTDDDQTTFSDLGTADTTTAKLEEILANQKKILDLLSSIPIIKEEISGIKKVLTNQGAAISTLDGYMSQLMIVIPRSGVVENTSDKEVNPDLRMVIGRDQSRGRTEITKKYDAKDKIMINEEMYVVPEVDEKYILKEIDNTKNNAANFIPTTDLVSIQIIKDIIDVEVNDPILKEQLLDLVESGMNSIPSREIYNMIRKILDDIQ